MKAKRKSASERKKKMKDKTVSEEIRKLIEKVRENADSETLDLLERAAAQAEMKERNGK